MSKKDRNKLILEGSEEAFKQIQYLFKSGELSKLLGVSVLSVRAIPKNQEAILLVNLSQCLQKNFTTAIAAGWKVFQELLELPQAELGYQSSFWSIEGESVNKLIEQLHTSSDEYIRLQFAQRIAKIDPNNSTAVTALVELLRITQDEELRWRAVNSLAKIAPNSLPNSIGIMREIVEELRLANHPIKLSVSVIEITNEKVSVFLRLYLADGQTTLPKGLKLIVLDEVGEIFAQVASKHEEYKIIQYKIICQLGKRFSIRVILGSDSLTEGFVV